MVPDTEIYWDIGTSERDIGIRYEEMGKKSLSGSVFGKTGIDVAVNGD